MASSENQSKANNFYNCTQKRVYVCALCNTAQEYMGSCGVAREFNELYSRSRLDGKRYVALLLYMQTHRLARLTKYFGFKL